VVGVGVLLVSIGLAAFGLLSAGLVPVAMASGSSGTAIGMTPSAPPPLSITNAVINPNPVSAGNQFSVSVSVSGGSPPYSFNWNPTPPGCNPGNVSSWQCSVGQSGNYQIGLTVRDSGTNQTSQGWSITVSTSENNNGGNGHNGSGSSNNSNGFNLSSFGPLLIYGLIAGIVGFALLVALTVGVIMIALILARRLPRIPKKGLTCSSCGATAPPGAKFCPACAAPLAPGK
jgi:hypothetical protein